MDSKKEGFVDDHSIWYETTINEITTKANKLVDSMMFFHIPLPEIVLAYYEFLHDPSLGSGVNDEKFYVQQTVPKIFNKIVELQSTKLLVYGHDHINTLIMKYNDILFCYGLKTGMASYYDKNLIGGNLYTLDQNNKMNVERVFV